MIQINDLDEPLPSSTDEAGLQREILRMITERTRDRGGLALKRMIILVPNSSVIPDNFLFPTSGLCTLYS